MAFPVVGAGGVMLAFIAPYFASGRLIDLLTAPYKKRPTRLRRECRCYSPNSLSPG